LGSGNSRESGLPPSSILQVPPQPRPSNQTPTLLAGVAPQCIAGVAPQCIANDVRPADRGTSASSRVPGTALREPAGVRCTGGPAAQVGVRPAGPALPSQISRISQLWSPSRWRARRAESCCCCHAFPLRKPVCCLHLSAGARQSKSVPSSPASELGRSELPPPKNVQSALGSAWEAN
jgi:hypothetical protein